MELMLSDFIFMVKRKDNFIEFLINQGIFEDSVECERYGSLCHLDKDNLRYKCSKNVEVRRRAGRAPIKRSCSFSQSARKNTFFDGHLGLEKTALFLGYFLLLPHPRCNFLMQELSISAHSIVDWSDFCRGVCIEWCITNSTKLGGVGKVVEIDEAKFGRRKYNRGRLIEGQWIFGGIERDSSKIFLVPVPDRSAETLIGLIREWVHPGTTAISDCWKAYRNLDREGFEHATVNHSMNFVDPDTGAHTQNIERVWREVRSGIPRYGRKKEHVVGYLAEFIFKRTFPFGERIHNFLITTKTMY